MSSGNPPISVVTGSSRSAGSSGSRRLPGSPGSSRPPATSTIARTWLSSCSERRWGTNFVPVVPVAPVDWSTSVLITRDPSSIGVSESPITTTAMPKRPSSAWATIASTSAGGIRGPQTTTIGLQAVRLPRRRARSTRVRPSSSRRIPVVRRRHERSAKVGPASAATMTWPQRPMSAPNPISIDVGRRRPSRRGQFECHGTADRLVGLRGTVQDEGPHAFEIDHHQFVLRTPHRDQGRRPEGPAAGPDPILDRIAVPSARSRVSAVCRSS